jgi:diguanylate cyclase (GGDEF)-like protein
MASTAAARATQTTFAAWGALGAYLVTLGASLRGLGLSSIPLAIVPVLLFAFRYGLWGGVGLSLALTALHAVLAAGAPLSSETALWLVGNGAVCVVLSALTARWAKLTPPEALPASERSLASALQREGDGPWDFIIDTGRVRYSEGCARFLGPPLGAPEHPLFAWFSRVHPEDRERVRKQVEEAIADPRKRLEALHRVRRADGAYRWVLARAALERDEAGRRVLSGWLTDVSELPIPAESPSHPAFHDALTGLPNRALFMDRLTHALARARRDPARRFAVMYVDLEDFRALHARLGHAGADELLLAVAHRLESSVRPGDSVARVGPDEFAVLLEDAEAGSDALSVGERVRRALLSPIAVAGHDLSGRASIGLVLGDGSLIAPEELMRRAREAADEARTQAQGRPVLFEPQMHDKAVRRATMEQALRSAIERGQMSLHYQPIVDLRTMRITGFEALARWRHPTLGLISPMTFIPLAEETGLISELGAWILFESLAQARKWQKLSSDAPLRMSVNLSTRQLREDARLVERVSQALDRTGVAPSTLTLEVTESLILEDADAGARLVSELRERGVQVCMDDFGTGYSSLSYLHRAHVDALKIDLSFVRNLTEDTEHAEIVHTILTLAKTLGLSAIAEGVETEAQLARLRELGCDAAQGYLFSPPVDAETAEALLKSPLRV